LPAWAPPSARDGAEAVDIADVPRDPAELIAGRLADPLAQDRDPRRERIGELGGGWQQRGQPRIAVQAGGVGIVGHASDVEARASAL
jgi:hypothetical protein